MSTAATATDRVKLPLTFDVAKMQAEVKALDEKQFVYYKVIQLRAPAHLVDTSLPFPPPAEDYADGTWCDWLNTPEANSSPYLTSIIEFFQQHTRVTLVRLLRLAPDSVVKEHTDPTLGLEIERSVIRLTIPILTNDEVSFVLNDTEVPMQLGECWYLRLYDPHRVINKGTTERVNLTIDMEPNEWVRNMIAEAEAAAV
ncbi:MAG: aspartyl/asparaginyl beta-hydroxylase domain-containing protein [Bacteroidota bacterium]